MKLGFERDQFQQACSYNPYIGTIEELAKNDCGEEAAFHVLVPNPANEEHGVSGVFACIKHYGQPRSIMFMSHSPGPFCNAPGSVWHFARNECILDDSGQKPVLKGEVAVELSR